MENVILTSSVVFGLLNYGLIARWYVVPALDRRPRDAALIPLLLLHCFRYLGMAFLVPGVVAADLSRTFAVPAGYGDLLAALLALFSVFAVRNHWAVAIPIVWVFNVIGTVDLLNSPAQALLNTYAGQLAGAYYIPAIFVPALLVSHFLIFRLLVKRT